MIRLIALKIGEEYGILNKHLLCFDAEFRVQVEEANTSVIIKVEQRRDFIHDFFGEKISGITALVGRNGVGKSTLLRYLKELFIKEVNDLRFRHADIILYLESNTIKIYANEAIKSMVSVQNDTTYDSELLYYRKYPKLYDKVSSLSTVFYSNSLDAGQSEKETNNYFNISTAFLMENIGKINQRLKNKKIRSQSNHNRFRFTELKRQIDFVRFLNDHQTEIEIPFKGVSSLTLTIKEIKYSDYEDFQTRIETFSAGDRSEIDISESKVERGKEHLLRILRDYLDWIKELKEREERSAYVDLLFTENLYHSLLTILIEDKKLLPALIAERELSDSTLGKIVSSVRRNYESFVSFKNVAQQVARFLSDKYDRKAYPRNVPELDEKHIEKIVEDIRKLEELEKYYWEMSHSGSKERSSITFHPEDVSFVGFLEYYFESPLNFKFINFNWARLSAGEESLIAFYSRLFTICRQSNQSNILLLIDEGDLYFHPEWQRKYLFYLTKFFESSITTLSKIQIVLTSHSPFIVSDLMKENIIFLNRRPNDSVEVVNSDSEMISTFGGNIHTLFSRAFFMEDSTMSEFAWDKIQKEVLEKLNSLNLSEDQISKMRLITSKIGEPVLRSVLSEKIEALKR
jgi:predicted ATP-binding protein involved in virulence